MQPQNAREARLAGLSRNAPIDRGDRIRWQPQALGEGSPSLLESNSNLRCTITAPGHSTRATVAAREHRNATCRHGARCDLLCRNLRSGAVATGLMPALWIWQRHRRHESEFRVAGWREGSDGRRCATTPGQHEVPRGEQAPAPPPLHPTCVSCRSWCAHLPAVRTGRCASSQNSRICAHWLACSWYRAARAARRKSKQGQNRPTLRHKCVT